MLRLISTKLLSRVNSKASNFGSHGVCFWSFSLRPMSEMSSSADPCSFTVSYLRNSCGLSQESAISASMKLCIETPEKADSFLRLLRARGLTEAHLKRIIEVRPSMLLADLEGTVTPNLELFESLGISGNSLGKMLSKRPAMLVRKIHGCVDFFRDYGFTDEQIKAIATKSPSLFMFNASKNFKPKLKFLKSIGYTNEDVMAIVSNVPYILARSLEKQLIPCIQVLRRFLGSNTSVMKVIKAYNGILDNNMEKFLEPNISMLKSYGVPEHLIVRMFMIEPKTLLLSLGRLAEILDDVVKLGFDPNTLYFCLAIRAMTTVTRVRWEQNVEAYKSFGLSVNQIHSAFKLQPHFMIVSENKIKKSMDFLINKLNMEIPTICRCPNLLMLSLEKRIIPRCSVLQLLMSKGLLKENSNILTYLRISTKVFTKKIVMKYGQVLPDVVEAYEGKIKLQGYPDIIKLQPKSFLE